MKKLRLQHKIREIYVQTPYGNHLCILEPDEKQGFIVTVSGLPGVITWGRNVVHAKVMVKEAIELCIESRAEEVLRGIKMKERHRARAPLNV